MLDREELLDKYLKGELIGDDKLDFARLLKDPVFVKELNMRENQNKTIEEDQHLELEKHLVKDDPRDSSDAQFEAVHEVDDSKSYPNWGLAFGAILLCILFMFFAETMKKPSLSALYARNYEVYPNTFLPVPKGQTASSDMQTFFTFYENREYKEALDLINEWGEIPEEIKLYVGISQIQSGDLESAKEIFDGADANNSYRDQIKWYRALLHFRLNQPIEALPLLQELADKNHEDYGDKAKEILEIIHNH